MPCNSCLYCCSALSALSARSCNFFIRSAFCDLASSSSNSVSPKELLVRFGVFRKGRACRKDGVRPRPVPVLAGTELATIGLLGLFSLGTRRDGVPDNGGLELGVV